MPVTSELRVALTNARLAVSDWHECSTEEELQLWRLAQQKLIDAAIAVGRAMEQAQPQPIIDKPA